MSTPIHLSPRGVFPDVCVSPWGLTIPYKIADGPLIVERRTSEGQFLSREEIDTSMADSTFARVVFALGRTWLAYRAFREMNESAVLREVAQDGLGPERVLGPTFGNNPVCLSADGVCAWQTQHHTVNGLRISDGEVLALRLEVRPTGLSHLQGDHPVFVDDNRPSEPGMWNPVRAGNLIVGEGLHSGLMARVPGRDGAIMGGECFTPRCAALSADQYAAVTWGPGRGSFLILFSSEDIQPVPTEPDLPEPWPVTPRTESEIFYAMHTCSTRKAETDYDPDGDGLLPDYPQNVIGVGEAGALQLSLRVPHLPVLLGGIADLPQHIPGWNKQPFRDAIRNAGPDFWKRILTLWAAPADENPTGGEAESIARVEREEFSRLLPGVPVPPVLCYIGPERVAAAQNSPSVGVWMPEYYFTTGTWDVQQIEREIAEKTDLYIQTLGWDRPWIPVWQCFRRSNFHVPTNMPLIARLQTRFFEASRQIEARLREHGADRRVIIGNAFFAILRREGAIHYPEAMEQHRRMFAAIPPGPLPLQNGGGGGGYPVPDNLKLMIRHHDPKVSRSDPDGLHVTWDYDKDHHPINRLRFAPQDGSKAQVLHFEVEPGADGRYFKGFNFKGMVKDGTFNPGFILTVWDTEGREASATSGPVEVTSSPFEPPPANGIPPELEDQRELVVRLRRELFPELVNGDGFLPLDHNGNGMERGALWAKHIAWNLRHLGIGLARAKPGSGNHGGATSQVPEGFTTDIVALSNGVHWDFQIDSGAGGFPQWAKEEHPENYPPIAARFVPAFHP